MDNNFNNEDYTNQYQHNNQNSQETTQQTNGVNQNQGEAPANEYKNPYTQGGRYNNSYSDSNYNQNGNSYNQCGDNHNIYSHSSSGSNNGYNNNYDTSGNSNNNRYNYSNSGGGLPENHFEKDKEPKNDRRGLGIASMILGIVSVVLCCTLWISLITSILGLILGIVSMVKKRNGFALAGIITSSFGIALSLLMLVLVLVSEVFYEYPDGFPLPGDSSGHEFAIKRVLYSVKNLFGKK